MTEEELSAIEKRYTGEPVPACRVCGKPLDVQSMGGGAATVYACSEPGPMRGWDSPGSKHYRDSRWTQHRGGDEAVLQLVAEYRALAGTGQ